MTPALHGKKLATLKLENVRLTRRRRLEHGKSAHACSWAREGRAFEDRQFRLEPTSKSSSCRRRRVRSGYPGKGSFRGRTGGNQDAECSDDASTLANLPRQHHLRAFPAPTQASKTFFLRPHLYLDLDRAPGSTTDKRTTIGAEEITITARDLLSLGLGIVSELDAMVTEWLAEVEDNASQRMSSTPSSRRRVVVNRGWTELLGIGFGVRRFTSFLHSFREI